LGSLWENAGVIQNVPRDPEMAKNMCFQLQICPLIPDERQAFFQEVVVWKHLEHLNIVPLLGVTVAPLQLVSIWMAGRELLEYINTHPSVDRLSLVGFRSTTLNGTPTTTSDFRHCSRSQLPPFLWHHPQGSQGVCHVSKCLSNILTCVLAKHSCGQHRLCSSDRLRSCHCCTRTRVC